MRLKRRHLVGCLVCGAAAAVLSPFAAVVFYFVTTDGSGSPAEAERLKPIVEAVAGPEAGAGSEAGFAGKRFGDGEWVLGIGRDSHGWMAKFRGGGTLVVKDSRGRVRCFFGHVCGPHGLRMYTETTSTLDEFYRSLAESGTFIEQQWP